MKTFNPEFPKIEDLQEAKINDGFDIDLTNDDVYINQAKYVVVLNQGSEVIERFGEKEEFGDNYAGMVNSLGLAVDPGSGKVYLADAGATPPRVEIFAPHPPLPPVVTTGVVKQVRSSNAVIGSTINPGGGETEYSVEFGLDENYGSTALPAPVAPVSGRKAVAVTVNLDGLEPGTEYHYRVVAKNATGRPSAPIDTDHLRIVTGRRQLSQPPCPQTDRAPLCCDCRAYELVSRPRHGRLQRRVGPGPGADPLRRLPARRPAPRSCSTAPHRARSRAVATRPTFAATPTWQRAAKMAGRTKYVGIPANGRSTRPSPRPCSAPTTRLDTFAFGGPDICAPCFADGSTGIPVRIPDGSLVQGMAGSIDPGPPSTRQLVRKPLSADGSHLVFGSTQAFEPDGNDERAAGSIYDRNLETGVTQVVSKTPAGTNLPASARLHAATGSPSSTSPPTARGSSSASGSATDAERQRPLAPLHALGGSLRHRRPRPGHRPKASSSTG